MKTILITLLFGISFAVTAQSTKVFDPSANALNDINKAIATAKQENKHLLVKVGYNQCPWCIKLH